MVKTYGMAGRRGESMMEDPNSPKLKITDRRMLKWFFVQLGPHWYKILVALVLMILSTAASLWTPLIIRDIADKVIVPQDIEPLPGLCWLLLASIAGHQILSAARTIVMHFLGQRFVYQVRTDCYRRLMGLGLDFFERQRSGDVMSRVSNDVGAIEHMVVHGTDSIVTNVFHIVGAVTVLFIMNWRMGLIALMPLPLFLAGIWAFARFIRPVFREIRVELGEINSNLQERIGGIRVIKAFAKEEPEMETFNKSSKAYWHANNKSTLMFGTVFPLLHLVTSMGLIFLIYKCGVEGVKGAMTVGTFYLFHRYMQRFYRPIGSLAYVQNIFNRALASMARIFELFDEEPSVADADDAIELDRIEGRVELKNISFKYATGAMVLKDISVTAEPGETVAIVGRSGAGKTSLVNLIPRFYDPSEGAVLVDGRDLRTVTQESLRKNIGIVLQDTFLFNASVRENIQYAKPDASEEEIIRAATSAHAHDFIEKLENGYETVIGERGVRLSGGEKQRIAIARAFLTDPRILILDEATSMVDTEAEQIIQSSLESLMTGRTVFIIAHRLSTVRKADKIVVIDDGMVVEHANHDELMKKNGLYREMVNRQFQIDSAWEEEGLTPDMLK
jgi:ABC-type multidrug transport system fused ATPase/permease subunit